MNTNEIFCLEVPARLGALMREETLIAPLGTPIPPRYLFSPGNPTLSNDPPLLRKLNLMNSLSPRERAGVRWKGAFDNLRSASSRPPGSHSPQALNRYPPQEDRAGAKRPFVHTANPSS